MSLTSSFISSVEAGYVPDSLTRAGIRKLLQQRLSQQEQLSCEEIQAQFEDFLQVCRNSAIAEVPEKANEQHYEVPAEFFKIVLGPRAKYSSGFWPAGVTTLEESEIAALEETVQHADLTDGQEILELGCGWGSLSLYMAEKFPSSQILAISNSNRQREFIQAKALSLGLNNLRVQTQDMNDVAFEQQFDRVVSVEMFEHMRNHQLLFQRIRSWLKPTGKLFIHIFCQKEIPYFFEDNGPQDWMSRHFFSGGMMPSDHLFLRHQRDLTLEKQWRWNGKHYEKTCNAWLGRQDENSEAVMKIMAETYGAEQARVWYHRWRVFFMACAELFGTRQGNQWWVSHYLFSVQP